MAILRPSRRLKAIPQGEHVEQALGGMLVLAIARVDHVRADALSQELRRAGGPMADHHHVDPHGLEVRGGVDQGLSLAALKSRRPRR